MRHEDMESPTAPRRPLLARFAEAARDANPPEQLEVDPASGLLRVLGDAVPFVERLLHEWRQPRDGGALPPDPQAWGMATQLTESRDDSDPDLVRASRGMETTFTKAEEENDPDLIRPLRSSALDAIATVVTRQAPEVPDPDLVRTSQFH